MISGANVSRLLSRIPDLSILELGALSPSEGAQLFQKWLHEASRVLTSSQWAAVLLGIAANSLPLYLRLLCEEACLWRPYASAIPEIPSDVPAILDAIFVRPESPSQHGQSIVSHALGLIAAGRHGVTEDELIDVLGKDSEVIRQLTESYPLAPEVDHLSMALWARLYADLDAVLIEREGDHAIVFGFYHSQVDHVVRERYLTGDGAARHADLAEYFGEQRPYIAGVDADLRALVNERMVWELAYQLSMAGWHYRLRRTLFDAEFAQARIAAGRTRAAVDDIALLADDPEVGPLGYALQLSAMTLDNEPEELWNQVHGRTKDLEEFLHNWPARSRPSFTLLSRSLAQSEGHLLAVLTGHTGSTNGCAFTRDKRYAVSASSDTTLRLWDLILARSVRLFRGHSAPVVACAIDPDDQFMISASEDGTLRLWDLTTAETIRVYIGHSDAVTCCALAPDGRLALFGSKDNTLRLWDLTTAETIRVYVGHSDAVTCCALTPDGRFALSGSKDETLRLWDLETGDTTKVLVGHSSVYPSKEVNACAISADGRRAIVGSGTLQVLDLSTGQTIRDFPGASSDFVPAFALSPEGRFGLAAFIDVVDVEAATASGLARRKDWTSPATIQASPDKRHCGRPGW